MADPKFEITQIGLNTASAATPTGPYIDIVEFRVGSGFNYTPSTSDTALHGTLLYSGVPYSYQILSDDTIDILLVMETNVGPFSFGEVGLYLPGGVLFALAAFDTLQEKFAALGNQIGSRWKIHALLKLAQAPAIIQVTITQANQLLEVPGWSSLVAPVSQLSGANAAIVHEPDPNGETPVVVRKADYEWTVLKYHKIGSGTISSSTISQVTSSAFTTIPLDGSTAYRYILKFATTGLIRAISSITGNTATLASTIAAQAGNFDILEADSFDPEVLYASASEYNALVTAYNPVWAAPNSQLPQLNTGWNQGAFATLTRIPAASDWSALFDAVTKGAQLTGTDYSSLVVDDFRIKRADPSFYGVKTKADHFAALQTCLNSVIANHNSSNPTYLESSTPAGASASTSTSATWVSSAVVTHVLTLTYVDANTLKATFNGGGSVNLFASVATPGNGQEFAWQSFLAANGTINMKYDTTVDSNGIGTESAIGFYGLTGTYQTIYTRTAAGAVGNITYTVQARQTLVNQLQFSITFADSTVPGPYTGITTGVLTSSAVCVRPSQLVLLNPIIAFPTASSTGIS